jgi:hypothetical protein
MTSHWSNTQISQSNAEVIRGCIQKFPDEVDYEIYVYLWYYSLRSNSKGRGGKTHYTDSQNSDTTAMAESCTICSARSRRPVRKLLDTPSYSIFRHPQVMLNLHSIFRHTRVMLNLHSIFRHTWMMLNLHSIFRYTRLMLKLHFIFRHTQVMLNLQSIFRHPQVMLKLYSTCINTYSLHELD